MEICHPFRDLPAAILPPTLLMPSFETVFTRIYQQFWHVFTPFKATISVHSHGKSRQHLLTLAWAWRGRITGVLEIPCLSDNLRVLVDGIVSTALSNGTRMHDQNGDQEFHYVRGSCRLHWTFKSNVALYVLRRSLFSPRRSFSPRP